MHHCRIAIATGNVETYIQLSFFLHIIDDTSENLHLRSGILATSNALRNYHSPFLVRLISLCSALTVRED
ncbi:hypothetical protein IQ247_06635 [Plectonema cf. radiosum LEGE 06105]|uniref:Uncharacterized protein n=1 Tax=Plectonema cf. radiosum LEGE 06105 TaxID=945769 RepID=A0A8J7F251_9CYAN|nr:hypothetical protein [Plectonema radiosum]MBE9212388.1 hypothetical protein [Plectonema cf. radiosum LEGE 06105]